MKSQRISVDTNQDVILESCGWDEMNVLLKILTLFESQSSLFPCQKFPEWYMLD